jgi:uncharacterized phage-associated protein
VQVVWLQEHRSQRYIAPVTEIEQLRLVYRGQYNSKVLLMSQRSRVFNDNMKAWLCLPFPSIPTCNSKFTGLVVFAP